MQANIITQAGPVAVVPGGVYGGIDHHGAPPADVAHAAGWRVLADGWDVINVPPGEQLVGFTFAQSPDDPHGAVATPIFAPIVEPTPERFPHGVETGLLVMETETGRGVGYVADDETGDLLPIVYAHESPYDMPGLRAKQAAVREAARAGRAVRAEVVRGLVAARTKARASAAAAQNVPQMRDALADLDARLTAIEALLGVAE